MADIPLVTGNIARQKANDIYFHLSFDVSNVSDLSNARKP